MLIFQVVYLLFSVFLLTPICVLIEKSNVQHLEQTRKTSFCIATKGLATFSSQGKFFQGYWKHWSFLLSVSVIIIVTGSHDDTWTLLRLSTAE